MVSFEADGAANALKHEGKFSYAFGVFVFVINDLKLTGSAVVVQVDVEEEVVTVMLDVEVVYVFSACHDVVPLRVFHVRGLGVEAAEFACFGFP